MPHISQDNFFFFFFSTVFVYFTNYLFQRSNPQISSYYVADQIKYARAVNVISEQHTRFDMNAMRKIKTNKQATRKLVTKKIEKLFEKKKFKIGLIRIFKAKRVYVIYKQMSMQIFCSSFQHF
jgi:hypothetical protein